MNRHRHQGILLMLEGRFASAQDQFALAQTDDPEDRSIPYELACAQIASDGSGGEALLRDQQLELLTAELHSRGEMVQAFLSYASGQSDKALEHLRESQRLEPKNPIVLNTLGRHYAYITKDRPEAERCLEEVIKLEPSAINPRLDLANLQIEEGQGKKALLTVHGAMATGNRDLRSILALLITEMWATPRRRAILSAGLAVLAVVPYVGLPLAVIWIAGSLATLMILRRVRGALAGAPLLTVLPILVGLLFRWLLLGKLFP